MELVFDIGNSETTVGLFRVGELHGTWRLATDPRRTPDEWGLALRELLRAAAIEPRDVRRASVAAVVRSVADVLAEACERVLGRAPLRIDPNTELPIQLDVDEPLGVGADRIVNAVAAHRIYARDAIVVDLGTATTFDCVTREGSFVGGVIAPGARTAGDLLIQRAPRLPRFALTEPQTVIGRRTEDCLQSGIFFAAVDTVNGMVERIRREWRRPDALVVATGGLCTVLGPHCRSVQEIAPFLTLEGIRFVREHVESLRAAGPAPPAATCRETPQPEQRAP